jgi:hypothetical protein
VELIYKKNKGYGSGLIPSGSRNLAQSGSVYRSGSTISLNTDPIRITDLDPQQYYRRKFFKDKKNQQKKSKLLAGCTIFIPFRYKNK